MSRDVRAHADHPAHENKPDSPDDLTKPSWMYVARKTAREFSKDQCTDVAAALTYYAVLALFPALIALMSLVGLVSNPQDTVTAILDIMRQIGAGSIASTLEGPLNQLAQNRSAGLALVLGLAAALWSASGYVGAFGRAMNRIYEIREGRPFWKLRPLLIVLTLFLVSLVAVVLLGLVVSGPLAEEIGQRIGLTGTVVTVFQWAKWPILLAVVVLIVALLYYVTPNIKQPKFRWMSVGAFLAIIVWVIASVAFGFYVANFSSYDRTYGSLAGVIVFLLWLWLTNLALLFGAELDSELERGRELQAGIPAEEELQLPPRDDRNIKKQDEQHAKDVAKGREIRETHGEPERAESDSSSR